jgi:hypothetical protein
MRFYHEWALPFSTLNVIMNFDVSLFVKTLKLRKTIQVCLDVCMKLCMKQEVEINRYTYLR